MVNLSMCNQRWICLLFLVLFLAATVSPVSSSSSSSSGDFPLTPISNWQESWTASQAQSTVMALLVQDCAVILLRSPPSNVYRAHLPLDETEEVTIHGLRVQRIRSDHSTLPPMVQYAPSWIPVGANSFCAMTGLAMDVEHLTRVLQQYVDDELNIFDRSATTYGMTQEVAATLQKACLRGESRPYGVQAMFIGTDDIDPHRQGGLCMYTMDPSGTWQSWVKGTAIGKHGREIRKLLGKKLPSLQSKPDFSLDIPQALRHLMDCWNESCEQQGVNRSDGDDWELLILQKNGEAKCCFYTVSKIEILRFLNQDKTRERA